MSRRNETLADLLWPLLEAELFTRTGDERTFNPWVDRDPRYDCDEAPLHRRANLRSYLQHFPAVGRGEAPIVLVGEAPSWRGCRFSGIAFTAESMFDASSIPLAGQRTSTIREKPMSEASATIVWGCLRSHFPRFLLWNALPLHPHPPGNPLANRTPRPSEVSRYRDLMAEVLSRVGSTTVLAVGRTAERSLTAAEIDHRYVRHPSHGGAKAFREGVLEVIERGHRYRR